MQLFKKNVIKSEKILNLVQKYEVLLLSELTDDKSNNLKYIWAEKFVFLRVCCWNFDLQTSQKS